MTRALGVLDLLRVAPFYAAGAAVACGLKLFYSRAGAEDLDWVLAPTSRLVELISDARFEKERHVGWISHTHGIIVGPSCAGINFLIIALATFFFTLIHRFRRAAHRCAWLGLSLALAYALTLAANALRIAATIQLYRMDIYGEVITVERVHRAEGTVIYCLSLLLAYLTVERALAWWQGDRGSRSLGSALAPLAWYLAIGVGLPLANRAYSDDAGRFLEHSGMVILICLVLATAGAGIAIATRRMTGGRTGRADPAGPGGARAPGC